MNFKMFILFILSVSYFNYANSLSRVDPLVAIDQGLVRGQRSSNNQFSTFLGIPYASVDLNNPFGPAQPAPSFGDAIFNANDGSIKCPQQILGSELRTDESLDCLRLNIYVPDIGSSNNLLPVLFWIHGGSFQNGNSGSFVGEYFMKQDIIVVIINYRLGPYGFLCLDVPQVPGNQGLKDQYEALVWVSKNIASFGGNPDDVTIGGQSAGSMSTLYHLYSSKEKLYNKAILHSGSPLNDGAFVNGDVDAAIKLAGYLGLNTTDTEEALEFLINTPHHLVSNAANSLGLLMRPCKELIYNGVDNVIVTDPYLFSNIQKIHGTPVLIGHTDLEGGAVLGEVFYAEDPFRAGIRRNFDLDDEQLDVVSNIVKHFYIGDKTASQDVVTELQIFQTDLKIHPIERTIANLLNENASPVYQYVFGYKGKSESNGVGHSGELQYFFGSLNEWEDKSEEDRFIIDSVTTLWANFVKYGNPTPEESDLIPVTWEPVTVETRPYLLIDTKIRLENRVYKERMAFWDLFCSTYEKQSSLIEK